ncbi:hypothetical protein GCM10009840_20970 [Pseudolysinimonas kribbensis]|uniref:Transcription regulator PadR N-terminal domain-containing protein n=1 Tax=Pseudolysinimonas kribbensis TaxID=433641 RepID=A0ABQ6K322_9MICO|nr:hypothetical protein GCM10025881_01260 [Pseudolysinimonas kribbensis]
MPRRSASLLELRILDRGLQLETPTHGFYGFALARALRDVEDSSSLVGHGTIYKALIRMESAGLLAAEWEDPLLAAASSRPRRKEYRITREGAAVLARSARVSKDEEAER